MDTLFTTPYGSRLYGTQTETSDWDWKYIVLPSIGDMLAGRPIKNKFYSSSNDEVKNTSDDTDTEIVPVQTFLRHFYQGQAYAVEVAFGLLQAEKIEGAVVHDQRLVPIVKELISRFLTNNVHAMVSYAYSQAQLYSDKGARLQKLNDFKAFLEGALETTCVTKDDKLDMLIQDSEAVKALTDRMFYKTDVSINHDQMGAAFSVLEKIYPGSITIAEALTRVDAAIKKYGKRANQAMENDGHDWKAISHAARVIAQVLYVLNNGHVPIPFEPDLVKFLLQIKQGELEWEPLKRFLERKLDEIAVSQSTSTLPTASPELRDEFEEWLTQTMLTLYGVTK